MTTKYGTIPKATTQSEKCFRSDLGKRRPWKELVSLSFPRSFRDSLSRIKTNISYFHMNYAIIVLFVVFLSLLWRPVSLIVFVVLIAAWIFLYFLRDDPIVFLGYVVDEPVVVGVLSISTVVFVLTCATSGVVLGILAGMVVVLLHAAFRMTDDLILLAKEQGRGGPARLHLKETASSSYSSSL